MKIKHEDKIYETKVSEYGLITSLDGKIFFGSSEDNIVVGEVYVEVIDEDKI